MRLWIVEDGEKRGPFHVYDLRERIENSELTGEELAWHEDRDDWVALKELDVFRSTFSTEGPAASEEEPAAAAPPPLPRDPRPFLRFSARAFDLSIYWLLLYGGMRIGGADVIVASPLFHQLMMLPYVILDGVLLHLWRTSPGKALLGIRIETEDGKACKMGTSLLRAVRVYIIGLGLLQPLIALFTGGFSLWFTLKNRIAPWDLLGRLRVQSSGVEAWRVIVFAMVFAAIMIILVFGIFGPAILEEQQRLKGTA